MVRFGVVGVLLISVACALAVPVWAEYPDRPVTAIVGPAGGLADVVLRAVAEGMKKKFPRGLAVVNRSGAGGTIGASEIVTSKPDGNTFGIVAVANLVIQPQLNDLPYRTPDDYMPFIGLVSWSPLLAVRQDAPWKTVQEFVTAARATPGKLRVASPGEGTGSHLMLAILLGALVIHGIQPGPLLIANQPEVFWGVVASMYVGNLLLLVLNLPLVGLFVSILRIPQHLLSTFVLLLCLVGAFSLNNSMLDLWVLVATGLLGYAFRKLKIDPAPLIVAVVLGPIMEKTLRQTLFMAHGDWRLLLLRPLSLVLLLIGALVLAGPPLLAGLRRRLAPASAPA